MFEADEVSAAKTIGVGSVPSLDESVVLEELATDTATVMEMKLEMIMLWLRPTYWQNLVKNDGLESEKQSTNEDNYDTFDSILIFLSFFQTIGFRAYPPDK